MRNLYDRLGVRPDDDAETLKKAFRKAAKASHPDHHGDDPQAAARFRQISEAYEILRDPEQRAAYDRLLEFERSPLRYKLNRSFSDLKRHVVHDLIIGAILTAALVVGYEWFAGNAETPGDRTAGVTARELRQPAGHPAERIGAAEPGRPGRVPVPQMPIVVPTGPAAASTTNDHDRPEATDGEPASKPTEKTMAVASRESKPDLPADAGVPRKTEGDLPVSLDVSPLDAPSSAEKERNGVPTANERLDGKAPEPTGAEADSVKPPESIGVSGKTQSGPAVAHDAPSVDAPSSAERDGVPAAQDQRDGKTPEPTDAVAGSVKPPEMKPPETELPARAPAAARRHAPGHRPVEQAALEARNTPASDNAPSRAPDNAPARVFGVGF
jgi:curved DNA-binding protein CbpA